MTAPATAARSDFTHILISGTIVGAATAFLVIVFLLVSRNLPTGMLTSLLLAVIVLAGGVVAAFLPASFASARAVQGIDRKSTRLNSSHTVSSYAVFCF